MAFESWVAEVEQWGSTKGVSVGWLAEAYLVRKLTPEEAAVDMKKLSHLTGLRLLFMSMDLVGTLMILFGIFGIISAFLSSRSTSAQLYPELFYSGLFQAFSFNLTSIMLGLAGLVSVRFFWQRMAGFYKG